MLKIGRKLTIQLWKNSRLIDRLGRAFRLPLLILKDRNARLFMRLLVHHLSFLHELSPNQFFVDITSWSRNFAAWQRDTHERERKKNITLQYQPAITILIPIFERGGGRIEKTLESVARQYYPHWELYLLIDKQTQLELSSLTRRIFEENQEIKIKFASNLELSLASVLSEVLNECKGEFIGFLSGSDQLTRDALFEVVNLLNQYPDADIIYSDEAEKDGETLIRLFYKPGWSRDLFLSMNYIRNLLCCRSEVIRTVGGFHGIFEDDIKYDLILRIIEKTERVRHMPKILYHEQVPKDFYPKQYTADYSFELHKKALQDYIKRVGIQGEVCDGIFKGSFRVRRKIQGEPKVSIIIPTRDKADQLKQCIESIESETTYRNFEIIIVDNASTEPELLEYLGASLHQVIQYSEEFNFSKINNFAASHAKGEYLLFLNSDTRVISPEWLEAMLEHSQREEVGIVGAKLLYPNGSIQHAGVVVERNWVRHIHRFNNPYEHGYYGMADVVRGLNVVTGACLMVQKSVFQEVGGFEENLPVVYNDVDLCLKVRSRGYLVVYTPYALLYHYEGMSRWGNIHSKVDSIDFFYLRWKGFIENDIYINPNCSSNVKNLFWINPCGNYYNAF
ncbi:MAG: glycosyltransferase [Candidatus Hodarchaeota archaeon]